MRIENLKNPEAAAKAIRDFYKRYGRKTCHAPETSSCEGGVVSAHTLSAEGMLRPISRDGHVYAYSFDLFRREAKSPLNFKLKGIRDTSIFNGFCAHHDKQLFSPIEDRPFACSPQQIFLHAFRAVAKESFLKRSQVDVSPTHEMIERVHGLPKGAQTEFGALMEFQRAIAAVGAAEIEKLKTRLDGYYLNNEWRRLETTIIPFQSRPTVVCNFVYSPDFDFAGEYLQDFEDLSRPLDELMVTILPADDGGYALLSHLDDAGSAPRRLVTSLVSQRDITSALIWLVVAQSENIAFAPDWYEALSESMRKQLHEVFVTNADPLNPSHNVLREQPGGIADWRPGRVFSL